jgi:hypothetical protein
MSTIVPSFIAKVARAKKHLAELGVEINKYAAGKPYTVSEQMAGKSRVPIRRLAFTTDPGNTDIPIIAADVIYNLRSSLDHLMSALVANKDRGSAIFPIFFDGVWEPAVHGENAQRAKERSRWSSDTRTLAPGAVAALKELQPPEDTGRNEEANLLRFINRLSNRDRHQKLPVTVAGLSGMMVRWKLADGRSQTGLGVPDSDAGFFPNGAQITKIPADVIDIEIAGTPVIMVGAGKDPSGRERHLEIPQNLSLAARMIEEFVIPKLSPFLLP